MKKNNKHTQKHMSTFQKILLVILIIIFVISAFIVGKWYYNTSRTEKKYEDLAEKIVEQENNNNEDSNINFDELTQINSDVIGWIKVNNTTINYPIMKTTDNEYYLKKDIYRNYDQCGSIFMDYKSNKDFADKNTVIYGHHIKKGIMFADLVHIYDGKLGNDVEIDVYTPEKTMTFKVFSSYKTDPEDYSINTEITENEFYDFIRTLKQKSERDFNCEYENTDKILTLSTCDSTGKKRILVHAALVDIY